MDHGKGQIANVASLEKETDSDESGSEEEQTVFMKELEDFYQERNVEYKLSEFYGKPLNYLKLWRKVTRFGGYDHVTACKLWHQVGESFKPPKTCTSLSSSVQKFYEKALLEYEKHKRADNVTPFLKYHDNQLYGTEQIDLTPGVSFRKNFSIPRDDFKIQMIEFKKALVRDRLTFLNNASKEELVGLKGIGKKRATYILELREKTPEPFKSVDDLREMGLSTIEINAMMAQALGDF